MEENFCTKFEICKNQTKWKYISEWSRSLSSVTVSSTSKKIKISEKLRLNRLYMVMLVKNKNDLNI